MFDLMSIAFLSNMTRVATMLMATEQSTRPYREIGVAEGHHGLTHHQGDKEKIEKVTRINRFHVELFTYLLAKLKATPDGDGSLLDHSMIVYGSGLSDGNRHLHENLPAVLAGRGCAPAPWAAAAMRAQLPPAQAWYAGKMLECGAPASSPKASASSS